MQEIEQAARATSQRKRAVIYCRVSTDKQEQDGESLEYQEEKCRRYADMYDIDIVVVLREAKSRMPRNPREYLLKGHVYCATCGYKMGPRGAQASALLLLPEVWQ
jgi:predicted site-specific integrase-resolvase